MYRHLFKRFLSADPKRLHFAAHSHHLWPDVTFDAHMNAWQDAARFVDEKWGPVFTDHLARAQQHVAGFLNVPDKSTIAFAPNTHEFIVRLFSCIERRPVRVLTTDSEFYSFARQLTRWEEAGQAVVTRVASEPFDNFDERFADAARQVDCDIVLFSHVFFNSGAVVADLDKIVRSVGSPETLVVIDGYHAFMAIPVDISTVADRAFYMAGGYKYAMSGEGVCPMHCPPGYCQRPVVTGWFASFGTLTEEQTDLVPYGAGAYRFLGATYDPTGLYRFNAVAAMLESEGISIDILHGHVERLQRRFIQGLRDSASSLLDPVAIIPPLGTPRGNFLTFRTPRAGHVRGLLAQAGVVTDHRDDRLRIGFGLYQAPEDVDRLLDRIVTIETAG